MRIVEIYSHLNGEEYLTVRHPVIYEEIRTVIDRVDASLFKTKMSKEKTMPGKRLLSPKGLNREFHRLFGEMGWASRVYRYYVTTNRSYLEQIVGLSLAEQKEYLQARGVGNPIQSYKQTDFVKDQVAVEVQFGKYSFVAFDIFVKHLLFYTGNVINLGVEILPVKAMLKDPEGGRMMSTGIAYFEGEVYNILRHGRTSPPVPLLVIGIGP